MSPTVLFPNGKNIPIMNMAPVGPEAADTNVMTILSSDPPISIIMKQHAVTNTPINNTARNNDLSKMYFLN